MEGDIFMRLCISAIVLTAAAVAAAASCGQSATTPPGGSSASATSTGSGDAGGSGGKAACVPSKEICDGKDNNCDGIVDEGCPKECEPGRVGDCWEGDPTMAGVGSCKFGKHTCEVDGRYGPCMGAVTPKIETCNGMDDDCN